MNEERPKILIVEDNTIIASDLKKFLESKNYNIISVIREGFKVPDIARNEKTDVILMDIKLEGYMNGIEAAEKITTELKIPVIFLTDLNDDETFLTAADTKPYAFICKPFKPEQLEEVLSSALKETIGQKEKSRIKDK